MNDENQNGINSIYIDGFINYDFGNEFSIRLWVYAETTASPQVVPLISSGPGSSFLILFDSLEACIQVAVQTSKLAAMELFMLPISSPISYDKWHHVAMTYDGSTLTLYIDYNTLLTSILLDTVAGDLHMSTFPITLGGEFSPTFQGYLDDIILFKSVLTEDDVSQIYFWQKYCHSLN